MALRSLGSSLVAKSSSGGRLRETEESRIQKPEIPGKGAIGTLGRAQVEEPLVRQVPAGSAKIVSVQPTVEGTTAPTGVIPEDINQVGILPVSPRAEGRPGANAQALFQGGVSTQGQGASATGVPASRAPAGRSGTIGSNVGGGARPAVTYQQPTGESTSVQGRVGQQSGGQQKATLGETVGNRAILDPKERIKPISGGITGTGDLRSGSIITPTPTPTPTRPSPTRPQPIPFPTPSLSPTDILRTIFGTQKQTPVFSNPLSGIGKAVGGTINNLRSQAQNIFSGLRSLVRGRK